MTSLLLVLGSLALLVAVWSWAARGLDTANRLALVVVLAAFATAFNVVVPIPNVEATTTVVACTALTLGLRPAIAVAALAVLGTGVTGGLGIWSGWQLLGMALVAGIFASARRQLTARPASLHARLVLGCLVAVATVGYELVVTAPTVQLSGAATAAGGYFDGLVSLALIGLPFTLVHVMATVTLTLLGGPALVAALERASLRIGSASASPKGRAGANVT